MKHPAIIVFEADPALASALRETASRRRWMLREVQQIPACLAMLDVAGPACLVVKLGRDLPRELAFVDQVNTLFPDVPIVVSAVSDEPDLIALIMNLGVRFVHHPPAQRERIVEVVESLTLSAIERRLVEEDGLGG